MTDIAAIDALLPQTQCTRCGFDGCRPYAEAIAGGTAPIDRCPPGGQAVIERLAALTGQPVRPLDTSRGDHQPRRIALIDPSLCIGCTKCIQACPVDAIVGANRRMHTVIDALCSGCELCIAPCPVDCITLQRPPAHDRLAHWEAADADAARQRHVDRARRLARLRERNDARLARKADEKLQALREQPADPATERKRAIVEAAIARARARRAALARGTTPEHE